VSDIRDRGVPWTQLLCRFGRLDNDLNLRTGHRISIVLAYAAVASLALSIADRTFVAPALLLLAAVAALGFRYYRYFSRGLLFAARVYPVHLCHHLCNGLSFVVGTGLFIAARFAGVMLPGVLPRDAWDLEHARWKHEVSHPVT
jgi:hypothetical protein